MHANIGHIHKLLVIAMMIGVTPSAYADVVMTGTLQLEI